jgi:high affinity Mn2+ porin
MGSAHGLSAGEASARGRFGRMALARRRGPGVVVASLVASLVAGLVASAARADELPSWLEVHGHVTVVGQLSPAISGGPAGPEGLAASGSFPRSVAAALEFRVRLSPTTTFFLAPEAEGRDTLSPAHGLADDANVERFRTPDPENRYDTVPPVHLRQVLGPVTLTGGRLGLPDYFDGNTYAHDPARQFMNAGLVNGAAFDYASDRVGYTWGLATEVRWSAYRFAASESLVPTHPGGLELDTDLGRARQTTAEIGRRFHLGDRAGFARITGFATQAAMGRFASAPLDGGAPDLARDRSAVRTKLGAAASVEQQVSRDVGAFVRGSLSDGKTESWSYLDVDESVAFGLTGAGRVWSRAEDGVGAGVVLSAPSAAHRRYLARGGLSGTVGDGAGSYGAEAASEVYYRCSVTGWADLTADAQVVFHPGFDLARGPASLFGLRAHVYF